MTVCEQCGGVGGYHLSSCRRTTSSLAARPVESSVPRTGTLLASVAACFVFSALTLAVDHGGVRAITLTVALVSAMLSGMIVSETHGNTH